MKSDSSVFVVRNEDLFSDGDNNPPLEIEVVIRMPTENKVNCLSETSAILDMLTTTVGTTTSPNGNPDTSSNSQPGSHPHVTSGDLLFYVLHRLLS